MDQPISNTSVALIVGVTGMTGLSLAEALKSPTAIGGPWKVFGSSRRTKPSWFPSSIVDQYITFDAMNIEDTRKKLSLLSNEITHLFWLARQLRESEEQNIELNKTMLTNVVDVLKSTSTSASCLKHITLQTGTKHYMGPISDPSRLSKLIPHDPPFHEDLPRLPYPNFYYALEDVLSTYKPFLSYSIHRSSIIIGASTRSVHNSMLTLSVYAAICRREGLPFRFPGTRYTWEHFCDMTDARVLAEQHMWAAVTSNAKDQAFNCTNGDVFMWKTLWKVLCDVFEVEYVAYDESDEFDIVDTMKGKGEVWDKIVEENGLCKTKFDEITCFDAVKVVLGFRFQHVSSMTKSREFGFFGYANTLKSIGMWAERLKVMKIIP